ncbi:HAD family phosphatase [Acidobacteriia bacterium AH_259_A11_L15]|nr:HAD family phosphatase [Acidobacteriia bacterium AH_259_A11_L15]
MAEITALFWDVGGVMLTNGWDRTGRRRAAEKFDLDWEEFQDRHELVSTDFEAGHLTLEEYLQRTVFYRSRPFTREDFRAFMFAQSQPQPETLAIVKSLAGTKKYLMVTLNNESLELNLYRIEQFGLHQYFDAFFSSCFLGVRKPEHTIYRLASQITQRAAEQCLFIDDRSLNLECAQLMGMRTIHYQNPAHLSQELKRHGIEIDSK